MLSPRWISSCAFVLLLAPSFASADEASLAEWAQRRVQDGLLRPIDSLAAHSFSRVRPPPRERRVRVTQTSPAFDRAGRPFVSFAVDVRFGGGDWHENDMVGCVYRGNGELYVKRGDSFRPAAFLLGKDVGPVDGVCVAPPVRS